jgi:hypothetical protein
MIVIQRGSDQAHGWNEDALLFHAYGMIHFNDTTHGRSMIPSLRSSSFAQQY